MRNRDVPAIYDLVPVQRLFLPLGGYIDLLFTEQLRVSSCQHSARQFKIYVYSRINALRVRGTTGEMNENVNFRLFTI